MGLLCFLVSTGGIAVPADMLCTHPVALDRESRILPWLDPATGAYGRVLGLLWDFILTGVPNGPSSPLPMYYLYCGYKLSGDSVVADTWMNDVGEKVPNWFESARLYYAYKGDAAAFKVAHGLVDYTLAHGITPAGYEWPYFPQTAADAGAVEFKGFTGRFATDDVHVDHAGDMGATFFRMYLFTGDGRYRTAAIKVADTLLRHIRTGDAQRSPWPYIVNARTGKITADYAANWFGCVALFDHLIEANQGDVPGYRRARAIARDWLLTYPVRNGLWVDGHTDTKISGTGNLSNLSASNAALYILEHPEIDPDWKIHVPALLKWTEDHFVFNCPEPAIQWGAYTVAEQVAFKWKMAYQTARYAAQCALWYKVSGDPAFKERAYRSFNWSTYSVDRNGRAQDGPTDTVGRWWSDCYGEFPRMFYYGFAAVPEWAPARENHLLYSNGVQRNVRYGTRRISYTATSRLGTDYCRLAFSPATITLNGAETPVARRPASRGVHREGSWRRGLRGERSESASRGYRHPRPVISGVGLPPQSARRPSWPRHTASVPQPDRARNSDSRARPVKSSGSSCR